MAWLGRGHHLEGVERMAIVGRVHARIQNAEAGTVKIAADTGKKICLISFEIRQIFSCNS